MQKHLHRHIKIWTLEKHQLNISTSYCRNCLNITAVLFWCLLVKAWTTELHNKHNIIILSSDNTHSITLHLSLGSTPSAHKFLDPPDTFWHEITVEGSKEKKQCPEHSITTMNMDDMCMHQVHDGNAEHHGIKFSTSQSIGYFIANKYFGNPRFFGILRSLTKIKFSFQTVF